MNVINKEANDLTNVIAVSSDGLVKVYEITHGIEDYVKYRFLNNPAIESGKIVYQDERQDDESGFYTTSGIFYSFNEIIRLK